MGEQQPFPLFSLSSNPAPQGREAGEGGWVGSHPQPPRLLRELEHHSEVTHLMSHMGPTCLLAHFVIDKNCPGRVSPASSP